MTDKNNAFKEVQQFQTDVKLTNGWVTTNGVVVCVVFFCVLCIFPVFFASFPCIFSASRKRIGLNHVFRHFPTDDWLHIQFMIPRRLAVTHEAHRL